MIYFNIFMPLVIGMSTSESIMSISGPSAFSASITCLADLTDVTVKQKEYRFSAQITHYLQKPI
jgi:hypothetical protein